MGTYTDKELMEALTKASKDQEINDLYNKFFKRYRGYVFKVASQRTRNFKDAEQMAKDITQETFISVIKGRKSFKFPANVNETDCANLVKAWLGRIANNHFNREIAQRSDNDAIVLTLSKLPEPSTDLFEEIYGGNVEYEIPNPFMQKMQTAMNSLKERDKHILLEYAREDCIETGKHLSESTIVYLCDLYNTTPENIRQIKKRTLLKLKTLCFSNKN